MTKELHNWLEIRFYKDNIKKYHKYFSDWVINLTDVQISGYYNQMIGEITKNKIQH